MYTLLIIILYILVYISMSTNTTATNLLSWCTMPHERGQRSLFSAAVMACGYKIQTSI